MPSLIIHRLLLIFVLFLRLSLASADTRIQLTLFKRGGCLAGVHKPANLTYLTNLLKTTERRYERTRRVVQKNGLIRKWRSKSSGTPVDEDLLQEPGRLGQWYFNLEIGTPPQSIEVDLDLLSPDFYLLATTSDRGSKYNTFGSSSHVTSNAFVHPLCQYPSDLIHFSHLDSTATVQSFEFPLCRPSKSSQFTLQSSGGIFGLAPPSSSLARFSSPSLLAKLQSSNLISSQTWSLTLVDCNTGILTLGGTLAHEFEIARIRSEAELSRLGQPSFTEPLTSEQEITAEVQTRMSFFPFSIDQQFKWLSLSRTAASGFYHPLLMTSVFVNTPSSHQSPSRKTHHDQPAKILRNQPFLLDLQCPFILAPPLAAETFYSAIPGARRLGGRYDRFWRVPCANQVDVLIEVAGWLFKALRVENDVEEEKEEDQQQQQEQIRANVPGMMNLGRWGGEAEDDNSNDYDLFPEQQQEDKETAGKEAQDGKPIGTGFCIGIVVESRIGRSEEEPAMTNSEQDDREDGSWQSHKTRRRLAKTGLEDSWVLGEPFFRGIGVVVDVEGNRLGFRNY